MSEGANELLRQVAQSSLTEAYDAADAALRECEVVAKDVAGMVQTARDLLFAARVQLDGPS